MATTDNESPLIKALPPETDYISYLTIVEHYLTEENLPILHKVLQDETLTTNIGWDLVHLLVPLLPASTPCLQDIARLGNPREVILKVTESLRLIDYEGLDDPEDEGDEDVEAGASRHQPLKTAPTAAGEGKEGSLQAVELPPPLPLPVNQFTALLSMLAVLQNRIKTKFPSRFLSTTLQAILASFSSAVSHREEMVEAIVKCVKAVSGISRPALPSRKSSGMLQSFTATAKSDPGSREGADPEAAPMQDTTPEETAIQTKLLQSFVTHVLEEYMLNLSTSDDIPGVAWCTRLLEKVQPERIIPHTETLSLRFANEERLHRRIDALGQLVILARDLKISDADLTSAAITVEAVPSNLGSEDDPPSSASDIPLSRTGSLLLYTARRASSILYDLPGKTSTSTPPFAIFPDHQELLKHCLSSPSSGTGSLGTEPYALIDASLALGLIALEHDAIGQPQTDEDFNQYLQTISLLSSNCPSPNLRGHAHYLASTVLRSHPDESVRLAFIRDTLEHCPFENLKVSAVGWIKGETIEANPPSHTSEATNSTHQSSIFSQPLALDSLSPYLFPSLTDLSVSADADADPESHTTFIANLPFYLASLNFLYLLLCAKHLHEPLGIADLWKDNDIAGSFLQPLREVSGRLRERAEAGTEGLETGKGLDMDGVVEVAELNVLDNALERVTKAVGVLNEA